MTDKIIEVGRRYGIEIERRQAREWSMGKSKLSRLLCAVVEDLSDDEGGLAMKDVRHIIGSLKTVRPTTHEERPWVEKSSEELGKKAAPTALESGSELSDGKGLRPVPPIIDGVVYYDSTPKVGGDGKKPYPMMSVEEAKKGLSPGALAEIERQESKHGKKGFIESAAERLLASMNAGEVIFGAITNADVDELIEAVAGEVTDDPVVIEITGPEWGKLASDVAEPEEYEVSYVGDAPGVKDGWKKVGTVISVCVDEVAYSVKGIGVVEVGGDWWLMAEGGKLEKQ